MSGYFLKDLVRVREHREDKASKAVSMALRAVKEAEEELRNKQLELEQFHRFRLVEEERLMQEIMKKPVKLGDITDLKLDISFLREKELAYKDLVHQAEGALDRAKQALEEARAAHKKAQQDLEKLIEHRRSWQREDAFEQERLADVELEDFRGVSLDSLTPSLITGYELH